MAVGRWLLFDTSVYVDAIRTGLDSHAYQALHASLSRTYLASVVAAELRAGAMDARGKRAVVAATQRAERAGRVVTPSASSWIQAGDLLSELRHREPGLRSRITRLWNDVLIALSARQVGAAVVTTDLRDFVLLRRYFSFALEPLDRRTRE